MSFTEMIKNYSATFALNPEVVAAVILQESQGNKWAGRYEEVWWAKRLLNRLRKNLAGWTPVPGQNPSLYDEKVWRAHSFGLMQILGETARVMGFKGQYLFELFDPETNLHYGCMYLHQCLVKARGANTQPVSIFEYKAALLFYNGGGDPLYPEKVMDRIESGEVKNFLT